MSRPASHALNTKLLLLSQNSRNGAEKAFNPTPYQEFRASLHALIAEALLCLWFLCKPTAEIFSFPLPLGVILQTSETSPLTAQKPVG